MSTLTVRCIGADGQLKEGGAEWLDAPGRKWIDLLAPEEATLQPLADRLGLHRLAVEDALHLDQRPKLEDYPNHLFLVLQGFMQGPGDICNLQLHEMHFFLSDEWLVTVHDLPNAAIDQAAKLLRADPATSLGKGPDFVMYLVADALVDEHFPILDRLAEALDDVEDRVFESADRTQLARMFELRRSFSQLRRVLSPQRDVVGLLSRRGVTHVQDRTTLYFRDVTDHLFRLYEQLDTDRELLASVKDAYLSLVAQKTNDITKQLTLFASLFMPLSFIVGFFGQNFEQLNRPGFFWVMVGCMIAVPVGTIVWFQRHRWL